MSIRWKILLILSVVFALFVVLTRGLQRVAVEPSFASLERKEAAADLRRAADALRRERELLSAFARSWSARDDCYEFMRTRDPAFVKSNLSPQTFTGNGLNLVWFADPAGRVVWGETRDHKTGEPIEIKDFTPASLDARHPLVRHADPLSATAGLLATSRGAMLIVSRPLVTGTGRGPIRGALVMGRLLGADEMAALGRRAGVRCTLWRANDPAVPAGARAAVKKLAPVLPDAEPPAPLVEEAGDNLVLYTALPDVQNRPAFLLRAEVPRAITQEGESAMRVALAGTLAGGVALLGAAWLVLRWVVVRPVLAVTRHLVSVARRDELPAPLGLKRNDEIGTLAGEADRMVARLGDSRRKMLDSAHKAGLAEIASQVLHNVGDALNTIDLSTELLSETTRASKVEGLGKAARMFADHRPDLVRFLTADPKGRKLIDYIGRLSELLSGEQGKMLRELETLRGKVSHVKQIIAIQQEYASRTGPGEEGAGTGEGDVVEVLEDALKMHTDDLARRDVALDRDLDDLPPVRMHKSKLMQVFVNLLKNAIESMAERAEKGGPALAGRMLLSVRAKADADGCVSVEIEDTGAGIAEANLGRIFAGGFSTKPGGKGAGLHFCATAVAEMSGGLAVASDGPGRGATFTVQLPRSDAGEEGAADPSYQLGYDTRERAPRETPAAAPAFGEAA